MTTVRMGAFVLDNFLIRISNSRFIVIASGAKQSIATAEVWIASSLRSSQ
jgi:hypothetical protein